MGAIHQTSSHVLCFLPASGRAHACACQRQGLRNGTKGEGGRVGEGGKETKRENKSEKWETPENESDESVCESVRAGPPRPSRRGTASGCRMRALVLLFLASVSPRRVCDPLWAEKRWDYPGKQTNGTALTPGRKQAPYAKSLLKASRVQRANRNLSTLARLPALHSVDTVRLGSLQSAAVVRIAYYGIS
ncbi:hypothetical protein CSIM01_08901 [Colletotrichum simmondsii]|uniref:Uncharacterized protein n=1 Tax=Colletotrichum simmondsii TaxID=703756 RepID=A0A135SHF3_9PEZI|nr:hypothetical protein CSIM01_08901 [Colletotrichum simmondsii]